MCFGEEQTEPKKSYEVVQGEEIDFLKTQLIKSNNKIDDLNEKIEKLEYKEENNFASTYSVDQIYQNSMQYYDRTISHVKWIASIAGAIISLLLTALLGSTWYIKKVGDKELKEKIQKETSKLDEKFNKRIEEYNKKMIENEMKVESLKQEYEKNIISIKKNVEKVEFNTELAIAINKSKNEDKIEELKKLVKKYPQKFQIYFELGVYLDVEKNYEEIIEIINKLKGLNTKKANRYLAIGCLYELLGKSKNEEKNYIDAKIYFEEAINNYKKAKKINLNAKRSIGFQKGIERIEKKLEEMKEKE